jgi:lysozyme
MAMRQLNANGLTLIKRFEGIEDGNPTTVNLDPYLDPIGIWTIGWGHAITDAKGRYLRGKEQKAAAYALYPGGLTFLQAETLLLADSLESSKDVNALVKVALSDNQFSALVSFEFNTGALGSSTLLKKLNAGDYTAAADQFLRWTKARDAKGNLVELPGLVMRRKAERQLFLTA